MLKFKHHLQFTTMKYFNTINEVIFKFHNLGIRLHMNYNYNGISIFIVILL